MSFVGNWDESVFFFFCFVGKEGNQGAGTTSRLGRHNMGGISQLTRASNWGFLILRIAAKKGGNQRAGGMSVGRFLKFIVYRLYIRNGSSCWKRLKMGDWGKSRMAAEATGS